MSQFLQVLRFELAFRRRHPPLWIFTGVCFLFAFLSVAIDGGMSPFGGEGTVAINSPAALTRMLLTFCLLLGLVIATAFVASAVNRDDEYGIQSLFFTTPLRKLPYLLGRFCGAMLASFLMISGLALGAMLASVMPWLDPERVVAFSLTPYLYGLVVLLFPNLLLIGALSFAVATLTRRLLYAYVGLLGLLVLYIVSGNYIGDLDNDFFAAVSDPFAIRTYGYAIRYWTPAELNSVAAPMTLEIVVNRLLWTGLALAVLGLTLVRYRMQLVGGEAGGRRRRRRRKAEAEAEADQARPTLASLPSMTPRHDWRSALAALRVQSRAEIRGLVRSLPFLIIALFGAGNILGGASSLIHRGGTVTLPVTHIMLTVVAGGMSLFMLIVLVFYAGELVHRERRYEINELFDALPVANWVPLVAKLLAMLVGMFVLLLVAATVTAMFQLGKGYTTLELGLYVRDIILLQLPGWVVLSVAAIVAQVLVNHKFLGYGVMVLIVVAQLALPALDFEHNLYNFSSTPTVTYSDMNGYGHFVAGQVAFTIYWWAVALLLLLIAELFWIRGTDNPLRLRIRAARARLSRGRVTAIVVASLLWLGSGGFIYYNTNILNRYLPSDRQEQLQARYEREYKQYEGMAQPRITGVEIEVDLEPELRRVAVRGTLTVVNNSGEPIREIHVVGGDPDVEIAALEIPGASLSHDDPELGYRIYTLAEPMQPGAGFTVRYDYRKHLRGFGNQANDNQVVANGSFINSGAYMPHFGYEPGNELTDPNTRRDHDLPPRPRMAKIDDQKARQNTYISSDSDWVRFAATVSTAPDQIAVAPGYLTREWEQDGRRYFRYEMDAPILNFWSVLSARYTVTRDQWIPADGGEPVAIEIFHHDRHDYNVEKMIAAVKESLDHFTVAFSPYQHRQVRILEFPQYARFAQSFPNTIPYSESIGFIADANIDDDEIDYVVYVTAHEVAHQWWAHQVIGANVQGCTLMSESLAQYSALNVMERHYGPEKIPQFLRYELDRYLDSRSAEAIAEMPLLLVENQQYIHYNKGSLVFYALREYIGEDALNAALRDYIAEVGFQDPPYTVSTDLYAHLQRATPEKYAYLLEDMFEKITLYDNRVRSAAVRARDDGKFELTLAVQVRKFYADAKGIETPAEGLNDWIEVGAYVERDGKEVPIFLELRQFSGDDEITLILDERPSKAGIDPRNLLIDREPDDNLEAVDGAE